MLVVCITTESTSTNSKCCVTWYSGDVLCRSKVKGVPNEVTLTCVRPVYELELG